LAGLSGWGGAAVGAAIGAVTFDLSSLCPGGPPTMPTFTLTDITYLLQVPPTAGYAAARQKFQDFLGNVFWNDLCDCSGGTYMPPFFSVYPSTAPQNNLV